MASNAVSLDKVGRGYIFEAFYREIHCLTKGQKTNLCGLWALLKTDKRLINSPSNW